MPLPLPSKERNLFAQVVKYYELKQFKKGLKAAEQILRKVPNHGDTQAMKALILNSQHHSEEAFLLAKEALKCDMQSHVCWHVYGLLWRSAKNYEEASKAYKFALRLEPDSQQILRDLAVLQVQMRDYQGYIQSRKTMLQSRSGVRSSWTALAVAHHLAGELVEAERTLTAYEETLRSPPPKTDSEHAEAVLYKNTIIAEMGEIERALEHIDAIPKTTFDRQTAMELRAGYLLKLGKKKEAEKAYRALLDRNGEYQPYYEGLQAALGVAASDVKALRELFGHYAKKNPRGDAAKRIPLNFYEGDVFREAADTYLQQPLHKGVPSTFANLKALYQDPAKRNTIQTLVEIYASGDHKPQANGSLKNHTNGTGSQFEVSTLYFLAQHYNYHLSRDLSKAMDYIDKAIHVKADSVDYHMTKARILKHRGDTAAAAEMMEKARSLDERDRYINTKAAKYQLRNNENEKALATMSKFTRNETVGGPLGDLHDMQCIWYITEDGEAYMRQGKFGLALKRFTSIYSIFETWQEDQFDFHTFSIRKGQIRAYVEMFRWEDNLREHPFFTRAAIAAVKTYILLHDQPHLRSLSKGELNSAEQKKAAKKARKDQEKQDQINFEKKDAKKPAPVGADGEPKKEDKDPQGLLLVQTTEPLKDAMKFLEPLLEYNPKNVEARNVGFEVFFRREKYLLALRCLLAALSLSPSDPTSHYQLVRLQHTISNLSAPTPPKVVVAVIAPKLHSLFPSPPPHDLPQYNDDFLAQHKDSPVHVIAGLHTRQFLDPASTNACTSRLTALIGSERTSLQNALEGLGTIQAWSGDPSGYVAAAHERWPDASAFR